MKSVPMMIADMQLDLHGCEYHESQQLTHIDGFLVYYNGHGRLTLSRDLTEEQKLHGVQRLLGQLDQTVVHGTQLYFWTRGDVGSTHASSEAPQLASPTPDPFIRAHPDASAVEAPTATAWLNLAATSSTPEQRSSLLHVPRVLIHTAARTIVNRPQPRRGAEQKEHTLIAGDTPHGHFASLSLSTLNSSLWSLLVRIEPITHGKIGITLGPHSFHAALTATGTALLDGIPLELLLDVDGPDLEVWLEQVVTDERD